MTRHDSARLDQKGLRLSVIGALCMAALGIGFSFQTCSQAVLLDGLISGAVAISSVTAVLLRASPRASRVPHADPVLVILLAGTLGTHPGELTACYASVCVTSDSDLDLS